MGGKTLLIVPIYIGRRWGIQIIVGGVCIFLLLLVQRRIYDHFSNDERYWLDLSKYQIAVNPDWLIDDQLKKSVSDSLSIHLKTSIFNKDLITKLSQHYQTSPWVSKVELIERRLPHDLKIRLELRKPFLAVIMPNQKGGHHYYLVDKEIIRLPGVYEELPKMSVPLPVVVGVKELPPPAGQKWLDKGLHNAITITKALEEENLVTAISLARIDVTNLDERINPRESEIVLWTRSNIPIQWGRGPHTEKFGELSLEEKIKNLKLVLEVCPQLKSVRYIKIQFDQPYIALEK